MGQGGNKPNSLGPFFSFLRSLGVPRRRLGVPRRRLGVPKEGFRSPKEAFRGPKEAFRGGLIRGRLQRGLPLTCRANPAGLGRLEWRDFQDLDFLYLLDFQD